MAARRRLGLAPDEQPDQHGAGHHPEKAHRMLRDRVQTEHLEPQRVPPRGNRPIKRGLDLRRIPRPVQDLHELRSARRPQHVVVVVAEPEPERARVGRKSRGNRDENDDAGSSFTQNVSPAESAALRRATAGL